MPKKSTKKHRNKSTLATAPALEHAIQLFQAGEFHQAENVCRQILQSNPHQSEAWHGLGVIVSQLGRYAEALEFIKKAIALQPTAASFYNSLGNICWFQGQAAAAIAAFQQALLLYPEYVEAFNGLGNVYTDQGHFPLAQACYEKVLALRPDYVPALNGLGNIWHQQQKFAQAVTYYRQALALNPNYAEAHNNLGSVLCEMGDFIAATHHCQRALALKPAYAKAYNHLGNALREQYRFREALASYQQALALQPLFPEALHNLANLLRDQGLLTEAIAYYQQSLALQPSPRAYSSLLLAFNYVATDNAAAEIYQRFNDYCTHLVATVQNNGAPPRSNQKRPGKLKIGYLSADFRRHSVAYFMEAILAHHDHQQFEIFAYYDHTTVDEVTGCLRSYVDQWCPCRELTDDELTAVIRRDNIDILVDLMGHFGKNRLLVLARKPAPVQITYLGYPNTTGLTAIDYRMTDSYADPVGAAAPYSAETCVRMLQSYFCYQPSSHSPAVNELPAARNGYLTLGSFNYYAKLSPPLLALWAQVLRALPTAKLLIKSNTPRLLDDAVIQQGFRQRFIAAGLDPERLILANYVDSPVTHLATYHQVDIALDSYPYNGATTTCEALWMGVPVVTLVGQVHAARMGLSILTAAGFPGWIASTPAEYVTICERLARDLEGLATLRAGLRERLQASPLMDGSTFTRQLEEIYRKLWESNQ